MQQRLCSKVSHSQESIASCPLQWLYLNLYLLNRLCQTLAILAILELVLCLHWGDSSRRGGDRRRRRRRRSWRRRRRSLTGQKDAQIDVREIITGKSLRKRSVCALSDEIGTPAKRWRCIKSIQSQFNSMQPLELRLDCFWRYFKDVIVILYSQEYSYIIMSLATNLKTSTSCKSTLEIIKIKTSRSETRLNYESTHQEL